VKQLSENKNDAICIDFAQMKASVELCINKLSDATAKFELKANCEKFDSEFENSECQMVRPTHVCQVSWRFGRASKDWQIDRPRTQQGKQK